MSLNWDVSNVVNSDEVCFYIADDDGNVSDRPITYDEVRKHIGLRTNVSKMTNRQFTANLINRLREAARRAK